MHPLVSILIPAHNAEKWITAAISSALAQTWDRKEIIVVDDGSRDGTRDIALRQASRDVCVVGQENQGAAAARNKAYSLAQGDYIQWLDADDVLDREKVEKQLRAVDKSDDRVLLSGEWGYFYHSLNRARFVPTALWCDLSPSEWLLRKMGQNLYMQTGTWLVSRELSEAAGPWDSRIQNDDDGEYFCRVIMKSTSIRFVPGARMFYRRSGAGSWGYLGRSDKKLDGMFLSMQCHVNYLRSLEESERVRAACLQYLQTLAVYFHPEREDLLARLDALARRLGGELTVPPLSWKYAWIQRMFGWKPARRMQKLLPTVKESFVNSYDRAMFYLEGGGQKREACIE